MNPIASNIQGLPKVHKTGCLIRPIINWQGAPAYKLAKHLNKLIQMYIPLPDTFNVNNSTHLIDDLLTIPYMGASSLAILLEVFLQHLEHTKIIELTMQNNITGYFRYVDDVLMIYDENITDIHEVHTAFNETSPMLKFTIEKETGNSINFLNIVIQNKDNKLQFDIYRKPTATDVIILQDSCHPPAHKHAAIRHLVNRMN